MLTNWKYKYIYFPLTKLFHSEVYNKYLIYLSMFNMHAKCNNL